MQTREKSVMHKLCILLDSVTMYIQRSWIITSGVSGTPEAQLL